MIPAHYPSEAWRATYDAWKLATPPEYDTEEQERFDDEFEREEFEHYAMDEIEIQEAMLLV